MNGQNNNNVIRGKNAANSYESLDDEYTKEDIKKERNLSMMNSEMNKMNNIEVEKAEFPEEENFFNNIKNKGKGLFNKIRGDAHANLDSSELRKMDLQNKMDSINEQQMKQVQPANTVSNLQMKPQKPVQQQAQQPRPVQPTQQPVQKPVQKPVQQPPQMMPQVPQPPQKQMVQQVPQNVVNNKINNNANQISKKEVFAGLNSPNNAPKKGLLSNLFNKGKNNNQGAKNQEVQNVEPWMMNQPLSAQSLGVSQNEIKKEVEVHDDNSKFFNKSSDVSRVGEDNKLRPENFAKPMFERKVQPGKELEKKNNGTLIRYYLGSSYDTVSMGVFSLSGLLFGGLYLISNRLILSGLAIFAVQMYILCCVPWQKAVIAYAILALIMAFTSNLLIMTLAKYKIKFYRMTHPKFVEVQLVEYVKKRSKSFGNLAILIFLAAIGYTSYMYIVNHYKFEGPIGLGYKYVEKLYNNYAKSEEVKIEYDDNVNLGEYFTYTIDSKFTKEEKLYKYVTEGKGDYNYCTLSFRKVKNYNDANSLLQAIKSLKKASGKVDKEEINTLVYSKFDYSGDSGKHYYLSVKNRDSVFLIYFFSGKDTPQNVCDNMFGEFKDTLNKVPEAVEDKK